MHRFSKNQELVVQEQRDDAVALYNWASVNNYYDVASCDAIMHSLGAPLQ